MISNLLNQCRILVCRPEPAASDMSDALKSVGADVKTLPCIEIKPLSLAPDSHQKIINLDAYDHIIVLSQHAATLAMAAIDEYWPQLPCQQSWHAIGRKTAQTLTNHDVNLLAPEHDLTSEALLASKQLAEVKGKKILILSGLNGRNTLHLSLKNRGAKVDCLALYERCRPHYVDRVLQQCLVEFEPQFIIALSAETLENLRHFSCKVNIDLATKVLVLPSARVANIAFEYGFNLTYIPDNLQPIDIIRGIAAYKKLA